MESKVRDFILEWRLLEERDKVLLSVSGGPDSVALVYLICALKRDFDLEVGCFHLNHCLREDASAEAEFVRRLCSGLGLRLSQKVVDVGDVACREGLTIEEAGRKVRYELLKGIALAEGYTKIATGHHMDDLAETVLLRIARGCGLRGLRGVLVKQDIIVRPLLCLTKEEIKAYLLERGLEWVEDETNYDRRIPRNRVRQDILPVLEELYPGAKKHIAQLALLLQGIWDELPSVSEQGIRLDEWMRFPPFVKALIVQEMYVGRFGYPLSGRHIREINRVLESGGREVSLPGELKLVVRNGFLKLVSVEQYSLNVVELPVPGVTDVANKRISARVVEGDVGRLSDEFRVAFDWAEISPPLRVRGRQPGDRFTPFGMSGSKKLQDFFVDEKVPLEERDKIPIVEDREGILWVVGYRRSNRARITVSTKKKLVLEVRDIGDFNYTG